MQSRASPSRKYSIQITLNNDYVAVNASDQAHRMTGNRKYLGKDRQHVS